MIIRTFKYIFEDKEKLLEYFLISVDETGEDITDEELYNLVDIIFYYFSFINKEITEKDILRKIKELEGKGEKIMTILELRELKGIERGRKEGIEKGIEKGIELGAQKSLARTLNRLLTKRFGKIPEDISGKIIGLDIETLEAMTDNILDYKSLEDVKKYIH